MRAHHKIISIVISLRDEAANTAAMQDKLKQMDKNERKLWQKAQAEQKVRWINELSAMIPIYSDAVLAYLKAFQALAINIEAVRAMVVRCAS